MISWGGTRGDWGGICPPSLYVKKGPDITTIDLSCWKATLNKLVTSCGQGRSVTFLTGGGV